MDSNANKTQDKVGISLTLFFVFFIVVITVIIILIFYSVIKPGIRQPVYNFVPFPSTLPNIPQNQLKQHTCDQVLRNCNVDQECTDICGNDYECSMVQNGEKVVVNGKPITPGKWCLPKKTLNCGDKPNCYKGCGLYTGRSIFTQEGNWTCTCLYPDLFGGDTCENKLACQVTKDDVIGDQTTNVLVNQKTGHIWDPTRSDFIPTENTPYDKDEKGEPLYKCQCDSVLQGVAGQVYGINMPGDPYRCQVEPCTDFGNLQPSSESGFGQHDFGNVGVKTWGCIPDLDFYKAHSNIDGKLRRTDKAAPNQEANTCSNYDFETQSCIADKTQFACGFCNSDYFYRGPNYPDCKDINPAFDKVSGGSICVMNDCENATCQRAGNNPVSTCVPGLSLEEGGLPKRHKCICYNCWNVTKNQPC